MRLTFNDKWLVSRRTGSDFFPLFTSCCLFTYVVCARYYRKAPQLHVPALRRSTELWHQPRGTLRAVVQWCRHLTEIDLSFNQLSKWHEVTRQLFRRQKLGIDVASLIIISVLGLLQVAPLVQSIPSLESLNLSFNPLKEIRPEDLRTVEWSDGGWSNGQIKRLILNGTEIDWHVVVALLHILIGYPL